MIMRFVNNKILGEYEISTCSVTSADIWQFVAGCMTTIIMIVGVSGNLLTIIALLKYPRIRNAAAAFIISLCVADGLFCVIVLPFNALRFFNNRWFRFKILCKLIPFLQYANVGLSLLFIAMITINRYVMIAHYNIYNKLYRPVNISAMIVFCLLLSFGMQLPILFGLWGEYKYDKRLCTCTISEDKRGNSSKISLFIIGFIVPCIVIICCYTRIFWVVHKSELRLKEYSKSNNHLSLHETSVLSIESKRKRNEWKITKMVLAIFLSFLVCYLPITIVKVLDKDVKKMYFHLISYIMLYLSACVNPIIYVIMNKQYRKAYGCVLTCRVTRFLNQISEKKREEPSKTFISQMSVSMIPMNDVINQKIENN